MSGGTLYVCGTPIGNLGDISRRLIETLERVDLVAAEDTRRTSQLLNHLGIRKPLMSYHEHNLRRAGDVMIEKLMGGENIALVSDAGMPGISDPGEVIIQQCLAAGIAVELIAGPVAGIHALVLSGLSADRFAFEGFPDRQKKVRRKQFEALKNDPHTLIFYEAPHRLQATLSEMLECFGDRRVAVARELTKRFEEFVRGSLSDAIRHFGAESPRGEFVIVLEGASAEFLKALNEVEPPSEEALLEALRVRIEDGLSRKDAAAEVAERFNLLKKDVYKLSTTL
jgi:16S rRNA (cytidine1402-2'-O)-methyltransferase